MCHMISPPTTAIAGPFGTSTPTVAKVLIVSPASAVAGSLITSPASAVAGRHPLASATVSGVTRRPGVALGDPVIPVSPVS